MKRVSGHAGLLSNFDFRSESIFLTHEVRLTNKINIPARMERFLSDIILFSFWIILYRVTNTNTGITAFLHAHLSTIYHMISIMPAANGDHLEMLTGLEPGMIIKFVNDQGQAVFVFFSNFIFQKADFLIYIAPDHIFSLFWTAQHISD